MTYDPLRRRFGHGAARLPIGNSVRGPSLSRLAQRKVSYERLFATIPAGVCLSLGILLFLALEIDSADPTRVIPRDVAPQLAEMSEPLPPLEIEFWDDEPESLARPAPTPPVVEEFTATVEPVVLPAYEVPAQNTETAGAPPPNRSPSFDPKRLVLRTPSATPQPTDLLRTPLPNAAMHVGKVARPGAPSARVAHSARPRIDLPTRGQAPPPSVLSAQATAIPFTKDARPGAGQAGERSHAQTPSWSTNEDQRAFLTAQAEASSGPGPLSDTSPDTRLSPVSAAADARAQSNAIRDELSSGGWQQVPLDALPDCSPAGRQDELKRRILRAAPYGRDCRNQNGSFRFVETSNLGAFLMWSRTNPDAFERLGRDRDACVVLERALRCLSESSH